MNSRPVLFNFPVSGLEFAGCTTRGGALGTREEQEALHRDLGTLKHGAIINGVKFNKGKCCLDAVWFRCLEPGVG